MAREVNETTDDKEAADEKPASTILLASADDFATIDLEKALEGVDRADERALEQALGMAAKAAEDSGDRAEARGYQLLMFLCTLQLRVEDPGPPWGPRFVGREGRSYTASDFRGHQNTVLAGIVDGIRHPALRARVADVVWYNDRAQGAAAAVAIAAYSEAIERRLDGTYAPEFRDAEHILDLVDWLERSLQISSMSCKRREIPETVRSAFEAMYERALNSGQYVAFERVANLAVGYELADWSRVATDASKLAKKRTGGDYPMAVQAVWNLAARAYAKIGAEDSKRECQAQSVEETLRMRAQVSSAAAQAYWTRKAIGELRAARVFKDRITELRKELRELQEASLDEFGQFSIPLDITQERKGTIELFEGLTLPDVLLQFALLASAPKLEHLKQQALESRKDGFVSSVFGGSYSDHEGKTVAETPALKLDGEPDGAWLKEQYLRTLDIWWHQIVGGYIEPARRTIMARFPLEVRHFAAIAQMSPFVPPGQEHVFALGFARLIQGDAASAAYLLIPQLENSLRHVMLNASRETSKIKPNLLQEERSLSGMLGFLRPELEDVFGADIVNEIDLLFHHSPGPQLRHEMAHGKVSAGQCYHATGVYASWMIYHLTCLPLIKHWKELVASEIEQAAL
ncbi:hypothetical protein M2324_003797 [Rhodovulum sulfidophilum]|uniref:DUF4209 domain-containing protein n=1 Tax=Rhodovulum sulfidophilum TaxID=35806 RepID=UPI0005A6FF8C|nr:DUF4209 domain-containing protein [Rhodovulum sulfidophilum]ANB34674.1 hypothetical protein A6W98_11740 [Rhodovulum sulfidophilum DSM 1374]ANB38496.1 hypothetical protein A6024_11605 [Rhodovulum sulfidophilum]MCW2305375.1 hypothetical protein [Rhodovulum sulfidophilum]